MEPSTSPKNEEPQSSIQDAPCGPWPTSMPLFEVGKFQDRQQLLMVDMGDRIPLKTKSYWLTSVLPKVNINSASVDEVLDQLVEYGVYNLQTKTWKGLPNPPRKDPRLEPAVYHGLVDIFNEILKSIPEEIIVAICSPKIATNTDAKPSMKTRSTSAVEYKARQSTLLYVQEPHTITKGGNEIDKNNPDGCQLTCSLSSASAQEPDRISWRRIREVQEFRKHRAKAFEALKQVIWDLHVLLDTDLTRWAMYSSTLVDNRMRCYKMSRNGVVGSEDIDITEEPRFLIEYVIRIAYAREVDLGMDPTIARVSSECYDFKIPLEGKMKTYTSTKMLFRHRLHHIRGRPTHVFLAEDDEKNKIVIKDAWLEKTLPANYTQAQQKTQLDFVRQYFIPIITPWAVQDEERYIATPGDVEDDDPAHSAGTLKLPQDMVYNQFASVTRSQGTSLTDTNPPLIVTACRAFDTPRIQRQRWRAVYGTVGVPLGQVKNASHVNIVLRDSSTALNLLMLAQYRHRDISLYNMYLVLKEGCEPSGALSDLEYATDWSDSASHTARTGTLLYMSSERLVSEWMYLPTTDDGAQITCSRLSPLILEGQQTPGAPESQTPEQPAPPFRGTPLHDVEEMFWVAVYKLLHSVPASDPVPAPWQVEVRNLLFQLRDDTAVRRQTFLKQGRVSEPGRAKPSNEDMVPAPFFTWLKVGIGTVAYSTRLARSLIPITLPWSKVFHRTSTFLITASLRTIRLPYRGQN
ncbi:hypothetical protein DACRYDRAFT_111404 [Dacryopinax primogenitus]|uniref:Fungal-type protein kinase domain-containing protein n=1 Tax=Dacryopinax primogenitus (strain DJM 731) TaxID=1858805 RepID=M5FS06_DACPD|nr:uncharacterized protein DACRYDRAFT_111404 [Dacryopinax primogenitus]EJT97884.1 hypothetical protein DACRYDRAFT_111404 [Dacryopinax primogenitus]